MSEQLDILFILAPKTKPDAPTVGPGVLKSHLAEDGYTSKVIDFNIEIHNFMKTNNRVAALFGDDDHVPVGTNQLEFMWQNYELKYLSKNPDPTAWQDFDTLCEILEPKFNELIDNVRKLNPRWVGISLLAWQVCASMSIKISELIREQLPDIKIIWGGGGIFPYQASKLKEKGIIDHFVFGDAENIISNIMKGDLNQPGIDTDVPNQLENLDMMLLPNFDDIDWNLYDDVNGNGRRAHVTGSRGCVRNCDFCDILTLWPAYRFRSANKIFEEMLYYKEKYGIEYIHFNDSLINGSMKAYRELMHLLSTDERAKDIQWQSQFIIRSSRQMTLDDWELTSKTNVALLEIGIESFSENLRKIIRKGFSDEDMDFVFEQCRKYKIPMATNIMVGHPFETDEDHKINLRKLQELFDNGHMLERNSFNGKQLLKITPMPLFVLSKNVDIWNKVKDEVIYRSPFDWEFRDNTLKVRKNRYLEILDLLIKNGDDKFHPPAMVRYKNMKREKEAGLI